jgi:hypothetical protein
VATEDDVRRIALSLPETTEKPSYGTPGFRVKDRLFARIHQDGGLLVVWCEDEAEKEALIGSEPSVFTTTPHYDGHPMVLVRLEAVGDDQLDALLTDSWRLRAPARVRASLDRDA